MNIELARKHLNLLFSEKSPDEFIEIRVIETKKSAQKYFYKSIDEAITALQSIFDKTKTISVGIHPRATPSGKKQSIKRCRFCVVDIDWDGPSKIMQFDELMDLLNENNLKPALVLFSGNKGYHIYFKLSDWVTPSDWEHFQNHFINKFQELGLPADTQIRDVARVMRLAGTVNPKSEKIAEILYYSKHNTIEVLSMYSKVVDKPVVTHSIMSASHRALVDFFKEFWIEGFRQELALWLSGYLRKSGMDYNSVLSLIKVICEESNDDEIVQREGAVKYTFMKNIDEIKGIEGLKDTLKNILKSKYPTKQEFEINLLVDEKIKELKNIVKPKEDLITETLFEDEYILRARNLYKINPYFYDTMTGFFYVYDASSEVYRQMDDDEILSHFLDYLDADLRKNITSSGFKNRLLQGMKIIGIQHKPKTPKTSWIKFKGVVVDLETLESFKPTPDYFFVNSIPYQLGNSEDTPTIDKLFESWVGKENKQILYEICAYCMLRDYPIHRIFILYGSGRNGKGSFIRLLLRFLGKDNVVSTELERLDGSRFETARLYQKLLAVCGETNFTTIKNSATLKSLSGQDPIPAEYKFKNRFEFTNYAKILISTNTLPMTLDTTDGFYARMIIIDFPNIFDEGKDIIPDIPDWEFENLALKCVKILKNLLEKGRFHNEGTIEEKAERYEERANPVRAFIKEMCVVDPEGYIPSTEFYMKFVNWMRINKPRFRVPDWQRGVKPVLEAMGFETGVRKRVNEDMQKRCIVGIKWKDECKSSQQDSNIQKTSVTPVTPVTPPILLGNAENQNNKLPSQMSQPSRSTAQWQHTDLHDLVKKALDKEDLSYIPENIIKKAFEFKEVFNKSELCELLEKFEFNNSDEIIDFHLKIGTLYRLPDGRIGLL